MRNPSFPEVKIVGMHFRGPEAKAIVASFVPPLYLTLEREPFNEYDPQAIKVFYGDTHIGYIERGQAAFIAPHMDAGVAYTALVEELVEQRNNIYPVCTVIPAAEVQAL